MRRNDLKGSRFSIRYWRINGCQIHEDIVHLDRISVDSGNAGFNFTWRVGAFFAEVGRSFKIDEVLLLWRFVRWVVRLKRDGPIWTTITAPAVALIRENRWL